MRRTKGGDFAWANNRLSKLKKKNSLTERFGVSACPRHNDNNTYLLASIVQLQVLDPHS